MASPAAHWCLRSGRLLFGMQIFELGSWPMDDLTLIADAVGVTEDREFAIVFVETVVIGFLLLAWVIGLPLVWGAL